MRKYFIQTIFVCEDNLLYSFLLLHNLDLEFTAIKCFLSCLLPVTIESLLVSVWSSNNGLLSASNLVQLHVAPHLLHGFFLLQFWTPLCLRLTPALSEQLFMY